MNRRYIHKAWCKGDNVQWDDLNWECYGTRRHGQIDKTWPWSKLAWITEDNGFHHIVQFHRLMDPEFP